MSKPKVGFYWCASCGGCEETVVDLAEGVLTVVEAVDIVFWPCAMDFKKSDVEAMADNELAICFINGAVRTSEQVEMAELLRRKAQLIIAFGSCAHTGGIPGLANLYDKEEILSSSYDTSPSVVNPGHTRPLTITDTPEGRVTLPEFYDAVNTLDQVIAVDYYLPGCPPPAKLLLEAVQAVLRGELPFKGSVLAPNTALCTDCPRKDSKPEKLTVSEFKRPFQIHIDPTQCLLAQGLVCLGPETRSGCDAACIRGNMPCTGCLGPMNDIADYGGKALSAVASTLDGRENDAVTDQAATVPDPAGTFYRYSLPASLLFKRAGH